MTQHEDEPDRVWLFPNGSSGIFPGPAGVPYLLAPYVLGALTVDEADRDTIVEDARKKFHAHMRGRASGQMFTEWDGIEAWVISATVQHLIGKLSGTTESGRG